MIRTGSEVCEMCAADTAKQMYVIRLYPSLSAQSTKTFTKICEKIYKIEAVNIKIIIAK